MTGLNIPLTASVIPGPLQSPTPFPFVTITSISTVAVPGYKQISGTGVIAKTGIGQARATHSNVSRLSGHGPADTVTISIATISPGFRPVKFSELPDRIPVCPVSVYTL